MPEFSGLQIDPRCIKCGRPPTADVPLYEMRNHLSICDICRQEDEQKGKRIAWVNDIQMENEWPVIQSSLQTRTLTKTESLPKNSLFGMLGLSTNALSGDVEERIGEKMRFWMREPDSEEKAQAIELLHNWQEELTNNPDFLQAQKNALQPARRKVRGGGLLLGRQNIMTAPELLAACEGSEEAWKEAEKLLKEGQLEYWIQFQVGNRMVANEAGRLAKENIPLFRALNILLYRLVLDRPFRFYNHEKWQPIRVLSANTPGELAALCDKYWELGEHHLYQGAMVDWLEHTHGCKDLGQYYSTGIKAYEKDKVTRGLGLELVLERSVPRLTHPKLVVTFDGNRDEYILENWDREIPHQSVSVEVINITRGFTSVALKIVKTDKKSATIESDWISLADARLLIAPSTINSVQPYSSLSTSPYPLKPAAQLTPYGRPVVPSQPLQRDLVNIYGIPGRADKTGTEMLLDNLETLKRGKRYEKILQVIERREYDRPPIIHEYPLVIKTMSYVQGFRSILWRWGLRGDIPGLIWNSLAAALLTLISIQILIKNINSTVYAHWYYLAFGSPGWNSLLLPLVGARIEIAEKSTLVVAAIAIIAGILGIFVGFNKGHNSYNEKKSAHGFRKSAFYLMVLLLMILLYISDSYRSIYIAMQYGVSGNIYNAIFFAGGYLVICILAWFILQLVVLIRILTEKYLRKRYSTLLEPEGRR